MMQKKYNIHSLGTVVTRGVELTQVAGAFLGRFNSYSLIETEQGILQDVLISDALEPYLIKAINNNEPVSLSIMDYKISTDRGTIIANLIIGITLESGQSYVTSPRSRHYLNRVRNLYVLALIFGLVGLFYLLHLFNPAGFIACLPFPIIFGYFGRKLNRFSSHYEKIYQHFKTLNAIEIKG